MRDRARRRALFMDAERSAAGFAAARRDLTLRLVLLAGAVISTVGAFFCYGVGRWIGKERLKRFAARRGR